LESLLVVSFLIPTEIKVSEFVIFQHSNFDEGIFSGYMRTRPCDTQTRAGLEPAPTGKMKSIFQFV
jgi:hypothetical protein